jgi:protein-arginine kinase activator protein McsA
MALHHLSQSSSTTALANASNWCAKCSIQFRLTSELVHHIRVHHATKRNYHHISTESTTRKPLTNSSTSSMTLTCHICYETFRERHHLTRHMTSHR